MHDGSCSTGPALATFLNVAIRMRVLHVSAGARGNVSVAWCSLRVVTLHVACLTRRLLRVQSVSLLQRLVENLTARHERN